MSERPKSPSPQAPPQRRSRSRAAGETIVQQATGAFSKAGFPDPAFLLHWPRIAGAHIARVAQPVRWQESPAGAVITLRCEPGAAVLLQHESRSLLQKVNSYLGAGRIARFKFAPGPISALPEAPPHPAPDREPKPEKIGLEEALERLSRLRSKLGRIDR